MAPNVMDVSPGLESITPVGQPTVASQTGAAQPAAAGGLNIGAFLTEGSQIPQGSALRATQSQTILPEWYTNYAMDLLSNQQAASSRPFATAPMPRVAEFTPTQQRGFDMTGEVATAYQPAVTQATQATQQAIGAPGGLGAAQPFLDTASQTSVSNIDAYMNPYVDQVVDRIGTLGARNLSENIMPQIEGRYISAGQLGFGGRQPGSGTPSGMMTDTARAVRDTQEAVLAQQADALSRGYSEAAGLAGTDLGRAASLASTAGSLGGQDLSRDLTASRQLADMGALQQELGLRGAGALQQVGAAQQAQAQRNLDVAYEDFLRQQAYPQEQINNMLQTFGAVGQGIPTAEQTVGLEPTGRPAEYQPGTASQIAGILTGLGSFVSGL